MLILRIQTAIPAHFHAQLLQALVTANMLALQADSVTKEQKDSLVVLNELLGQLLPSGAILEQALTV
jgi:hypothetical protein